MPIKRANWIINSQNIHPINTHSQWLLRKEGKQSKPENKAVFIFLISPFQQLGRSRRSALIGRPTQQSQRLFPKQLPTACIASFYQDAVQFGQTRPSAQAKVEHNNWPLFQKGGHKKTFTKIF